MKRLELLDYARFFSSVFVVLYHYTFNGISNGKISSVGYIDSVVGVSKYGYLGVELFFMISGYVIFYSAKSGRASRFVVSRAVRLYPAYWVAVVFTSFFALLWGDGALSVNPGQIVANLSMLQSLFGVPHVDGVYWTLMYELAFYFVVFVLLILGFQNRLQEIFMFWPFLLLASLALGVQTLPYLGGYYCYFSAGVLFAILNQRFRWRVILALLVTYFLCVHFSVSGSVQLTEGKGVAFSPAVVASVVTAFFVLFFYQNTRHGQNIRLPVSRAIGGLTYPIYIIHAHFGYILINRFAAAENKVLIYLLVVSAVLVTSWCIHEFVEKRLSHVWTRLFSQTIGRSVEFVQVIIDNLWLSLGKSFGRTRSRDAS